VTTDHGEYLVVAGTAAELVEQAEAARSAQWRAWIGGWPWLLFRWWRRETGAGRVEVHRRDQTWAWDTPHEHRAYVVANHVEDLLASGAWVPGRQPQPEVAGADVSDF
jgi:hypothetical protein